MAQAVEQLRKWKAAELAPGLVEEAGARRTIVLNQGCTLATNVLRQIALAYVALGRALPDIIPLYRPPAYAGDFPLVDPARDWYDAERP